MPGSSFRRLSTIYIGGYVLLALLIGGGTVKGLAGTFLLEALSLPLVFAAGPSAEARAGRPGGGICVLLGLVAATFALQVLPFFGPEIGDTTPALGGLRALALSSDIGRTLDSLAFALSTSLVFLAIVRRTREEQNGILAFVLIGFLANLVLALIQFSASRAPDMGFLGYRMNAGVFANQNHFSALLYVSIPFWVHQFDTLGRRWLALVPIAVIVLVEFAAGSIAGIFLAMLAALAAFAFVWRHGVGTRLTLFAIAGAGLAVLATRADWTVAGELGSALNRLVFAQTTLKAIAANMPFGSGFGTFPIVYPAFESPHRIMALFVNHAHDDLLELVLEGGMPAAAAMAFYLVLLAVRAPAVRNQRSLRPALLSIVFLLFHSLVDYPLRTMALANLFAFANAFYFARFVRPAGGPSASKAQVTSAVALPEGVGNLEQEVLDNITYGDCTKR